MNGSSGTLPEAGYRPCQMFNVKQYSIVVSEEEPNLNNNQHVVFLPSLFLCLWHVTIEASWAVSTTSQPARQCDGRRPNETWW